VPTRFITKYSEIGGRIFQFQYLRLSQIIHRDPKGLLYCRELKSRGKYTLPPDVSTHWQFDAQCLIFGR
jgi:hypothetical protein